MYIFMNVALILDYVKLGHQAISLESECITTCEVPGTNHSSSIVYLIGMQLSHTHQVHT